MSDRTEHVAEQRRDDLMRRKNVVGVAGGDDEVLVLVEKKEPLSALAEDDVVPPRLDGCDTDVVEAGKITPMAQVGASIGLRDAGTGTLGGIVRDEHRHYILTNNHVAADSNRARALANIHHPGPADGLGNQIGRLARFEPIFFGSDNHIDAALVEVNVNSLTNARGYFPRWTITARVGWTVRKVGRTTGLTTGKVIGRNATVNIDFGSQGTARFVGQILTDNMLEPGDSGSVLASRGGYAVGLSFAGSSTISVHTPISTVLRALAVRFD